MVYLLALCCIVFIMIGSIRYTGENSQYLSIDTTKSIKGISAVMIVLHHLSQQCTQLFSILKIMQYVGFILVAIFFFCSGYGLEYGYQEKRNYLDGFLKKRVLKILIPYWIINLVYIIYDYFQNIPHSITEYILSIFGVDSITKTWFVTSILICYILFYIIYSKSKEEWKIPLLGIAMIGYIVVCYSLNLHSSWTASIATFYMGVLWKKYQKLIDSYISKGSISKFFISLVLLIAFFIGRLGMQYIGIDNEILHIFMRNIVSILMVLSIMLGLQKVRINSRICRGLGNISYELYIVHQFWIRALYGIGLSENMFVFLVLAISLVSAFMLLKFKKKIEKLI